MAKPIEETIRERISAATKENLDFNMKDMVFTWTPEEWQELGVFLSGNGWTVPFMGVQHRLDVPLVEAAKQ